MIHAALSDAVPMSGAVMSHVTTPAASHRLFAYLADLRVEVAAFAYLSQDGRVLGMREARSHGTASVTVPVRLIAADALALGAGGLVMAHNHPSGNACPSRADIATTRLIARTLAVLDVRLVDHLILVRSDVVSLHALGII